MKSLLRRSNLLPGESLPSLIERLAHLNYYNAGTIPSLCHSCNCSENKGEDVTHPKSLTTFLQLAQLTSVSPDDLFAASKHSFAPMLYAPDRIKTFMIWLDGTSRPLLTTSTAKYRIRSNLAAQFCPLCLKQAHYHHLAWIPVASTICLYHQCFLISQCPSCRKNVSIPEIVNNRCKICNTELTQSPSIFINDASGILSQQVLQSWLSLVPDPSLFSNYTLPNRSALTYLLWEKLRSSLFLCRYDWPRLPAPLSGLHLYIKKISTPQKRMLPKYAYYLYEKAFTGILNWPQGFYNFLDSYSQRNYKSQHSFNITGRLGWLGFWFCQIWDQPEFKFLLLVLRDYFAYNRIPALLSPLLWD